VGGKKEEWKLKKRPAIKRCIEKSQGEILDLKLDVANFQNDRERGGRQKGSVGELQSWKD